MKNKKEDKKGVESYGTPFIIVILAAIHLGTCFKCSKRIPSTTEWALSNDIIGFPIVLL
jgi:hypothetical protein